MTTVTAAHDLLTIDEGRDLVGATAIAVVDSTSCSPRRLGSLLAGRGNTRGLTPEAVAAVRAHRAALRQVRAAGLEWVINDQLAGAHSYAGLTNETYLKQVA